MTTRSVVAVVVRVLLLWAAWFNISTFAFVPQSHFQPYSSVSTRNAPKIHPRQETTAQFLFGFGGLELSGLLYDSTATAMEAWDWTANMGAPAALVAGAVLATLSENRAKEELVLRKSDGFKTRLLKQSLRFLLLTAFGLEVVSIFVSTVTGSILLGHGEQTVVKKIIGYASPLQLLMHHHELEYLTTQICFLQGLLNWLAASAIEIYLPQKGEAPSSLKMNKCLVAWLFTLIVWMLAFYNHHLSFYSDYFSMLRRWFELLAGEYLFASPFRPLSLLYIPSFIFSIYQTWKAFKTQPDDEDELEPSMTTE